MITHLFFRTDEVPPTYSSEFGPGNVNCTWTLPAVSRRRPLEKTNPSWEGCHARRSFAKLSEFHASFGLGIELRSSDDRGRSEGEGNVKCRGSNWLWTTTSQRLLVIQPVRPSLRGCNFSTFADMEIEPETRQGMRTQGNTLAGGAKQVYRIVCRMFL